MKRIILMAETGSDITLELAAKYEIEMVPMHVNFDEETLEAGSIVCDGMLEILPYEYHTDGFFIAKLYKRNF